MADSKSEQPSLVQGHVQYVKGIAEVAFRSHPIAITPFLIANPICTQTTVGNVTGSEPWKASGEQDKAAGLSTMKEAGEKRDAAQGYGKAEELAGKLTGCEGMKEEGAQSSK